MTYVLFPSNEKDNKVLWNHCDIVVDSRHVCLESYIIDCIQFTEEKWIQLICFIYALSSPHSWKNSYREIRKKAIKLGKFKKELYIKEIDSDYTQGDDYNQITSRWLNTKKLIRSVYGNEWLAVHSIEGKEYNLTKKWLRSLCCTKVNEKSEYSSKLWDSLVEKYKYDNFNKFSIIFNDKENKKIKEIKHLIG